jgi:hypothetical protein
MSFTDPMAITYNAVVKNLIRTNQDSNGSDWFYDGITEKFAMTVRHTIPPKGGVGESHMIRFDTEYYDANSIYLRKGSVWLAAKSYDSAQNSTTLKYSTSALVSFLASGIQDKLLAREV